MSITKEYAVNAASTYLKHRGYEVIETNWKQGRCGIDLIATDGNILVLADVTAKAASAGFPEEDRSSERRSKREAAALAYLASHEETDMLVRFDDLVLIPLGDERFIVRHHLNSLGMPDEQHQPALAEAA